MSGNSESSKRFFGFVRKVKIDSPAICKSLAYLSNCFNHARIFNEVSVYHYPKDVDEVMQALMPYELRYRKRGFE